MRPPDDRDTETVAIAFLQRVLSDTSDGGLRSLAEYQTLFPGFEALIAAEFESLQDQEDPTPNETDAMDRAARASIYERLRNQLARDVDPAVSIGQEQPIVDDGPGRYSSMEQLAEGGMGTIRRVWDRDLRRPLAMKMLRQTGRSRLDEASDRISRFLEEAQVTSQLAHPGIVPVHEVGLTAAGNPYFTMALVRGRTLREIIDATPPQRSGRHIGRLASLLAKACDAVAYAHNKGVIHRDLKPSNIMVGRFGEVFVMDWGLARVLGTPDRRDLRLRSMADDAIHSPRRELEERAPNDALVTMDGDVIGTPAYMSPEQARGEVDEIGPRSDVYSLGAILYHMLTGRTPYSQPGETTTAGAVLDQVLAGPPPAISDSDASVPPELAAICEKAMARSPERRYRSALELGVDLHAFLEGRVVAAHETGAMAEAKKWVQRNKGLAIASCAALIALIAGLVISLVLREHAGSQAELAQQNATRAEASFATAFESVRRMLMRVGTNTLVDVPQMDLARRELLRDALELNQELLELRPDDPSVQREIALAHVRIGTNERRLGDYVAAESALQQGQREIERLVSSAPDHLALVMAAGLVRVELGSLAAARGNLDEAIETTTDGLERLRPAIAQHPGHVDLLDLWADALGRLASSRHERGAAGDPEAAANAMREAAGIRADLARRDPTPIRQRQHASAAVMLAAILPNSAVEKETLLSDAKLRFEQLLRENRHDRQLRYALADACNRLGVHQKMTNRPDAAQSNFERAVQLRRTLARDWPFNPAYESELAGALSNYGDLLRISGSLPTARELLEEAIDHTTKAIALEPERIGLQHYLYSQHHKLCRVLHLQNDYRELAVRAERFATIPWGWRAHERVATFLTVASDLSRSDPQHDDENAGALADAWQAKAVHHLGRAVDLGFAEADYFTDNDRYPDLSHWLSKKAELASLRERPDFRALQQRVQEILDRR